MSLYTSRSEFDLEKRIQFTNEIPPYDMFGGLNSVIQTDLWKWVLGFTDVEFGLPYNIDVTVENPDGTLTHKQSHTEGIETGEVYYKMVNGKVVSDVQYGPAASENKTFHRLEEYGVLLPEFDFLLHEVYRYLGSMYPDHPDMTELLTENEFNDMLSNAAALIDYKPDVNFFDKVASSLNLNNIKDEQIESAMIKLRNLRNEGFRKRLYGSKLGYRMLSSDIFQNISVFPVATYLPLKPMNKNKYLLEVGTNYMKTTSGENIISLEEYNLLDEDTKKGYIPVSPMVDAEQLKEWNQTNGYSYDVDKYNDHIRQHNRIVDTYSKHYNRKFRLVDYDGSKSSYPEPADPNLYAFGYSLPFNEYNVFEVPACTDTESMISLFDVSNELLIDGVETTTNYIKGKSEDLPLKVINYTYYNSIGKKIEVTESLVSEIHSIETSLKNYVPYKNACVYPPFKDIELDTDFFNAVKNTSKDIFANVDTNIADYGTINFLTYFYSTYLGKGFTNEYLKGFLKKFPLLYNPLVSDTLLTTPSNTISFYPHSVKLKPYTGSVNENGITIIDPLLVDNYYIEETGLLWDCIERFSYISPDDLSDNKTLSVGSTLQVTNFTKGYIDIDIDTKLATNNAQIFDIAETQRDDDSNGLVIRNEDGNLIVLEGKLSVKTTFTAGRYRLVSEHFDIAAIPREKTESMMKTLYGDDYFETKRELSTTGDTDKHNWTVRDYVDAYVARGYDENLARNFYSDDDDIYEQANKQITESKLDYSSFLPYVKDLIKFEDKLNSWKENSSHLYKNITYNVNGEILPFERTLIHPGCDVVYILKAVKPNANNNVPETITVKETLEDGTVIETLKFNESSYQNNVDYTILGEKSGYLGGTIKDVSFGNLNVVTIYGNNGQSQFVPYGEHNDNHTLAEKSIVVKSKSTGESIIFRFFSADESAIEHDTTTVIDEFSLQKEIKDYYEQSTSIMDNHTRNFLMGKKSDGYNNLTASSIKRELIKIESVLDISREGYEKTIFFETDLAREMFKSLSIGDTVSGPGIDADDNDVYITHIGDNEVTISHNIQQSGTFVLSFNVKTNVNPDDISNNLLQYKEDLYTNGLYSVTNPFEHGLWPSADFPRVSTAVLDSLPDISFFNIHNYSINNDNSFTKVLEDTHYEEYEQLVDEFLMPSDIKFNNELFIELNINKLLHYTSRRTKSNPILMSVDWLDYIENSLMYSSRATDNVNVGVNVMLETDTTGYYTLLPNNEYSDPQIHLKFITLNLDGQNMWPSKELKDRDWTIPCYAQIGNGGSGRKSWFKSPDDVTYPNIWGIHVYDDVKNPKTFDDESDFAQNGGELKNVSLWGQDNEEQIGKSSSVKYTSVESPIFEIPLGEYDTITKYVHENNAISARNLLSITQASFYSQTFTNIMKHFNDEESTVKMIGTNFTRNNVLISYGNSNEQVFNYGGVWTPKKDVHYNDAGESTNSFDVVYPENPVDFQYFVVTEDVNLSNIVSEVDDHGNPKQQKTRSFNRTDVLFYYNGQWFVKGFQYLGLVGDGFDKATGTNVEDINRVYVSPEANKSLSELSENTFIKNTNDIFESKIFNFTFKERLIQYYLRAASIQPAAYYSLITRNTGFNKYAIVDAEKNTYIDIQGILSSVRGIEPIHKTKVLYWIYSGTFNPDESYEDYWKETKNREWLDELSLSDLDLEELKKFNPNLSDTDFEKIISVETPKKYSDFFDVKDRIALVNFNNEYAEPTVSNGYLKDFLVEDNKNIETDDSKWFIFKVNVESLLGMSLPVSKWRYVDDSEYSVLLDSNDNLTDTEKCGITTLLNKVNSTIKLPRSYVTEGSYNFNITLDPHFISSGYLYNTDGNIDKSKEISFCTTKGSIYYDSVNDVFYTHSNIQDANGKLTSDVFKVAIKFNEQKFFKNTLRLPCVYQVKNALVSGEQSISQTPVLSGIDGIDFAIDKLSVGDKLLEVKELDLRSLYSTSLEPVFFSNYVDINYPIKGVTDKNELYLSYVNNNPNINLEKVNFTTDVMNLIPMKSIFDEESGTYSLEKALDEKQIEFGKVYEDNSSFDKPTLTNVSITRPFMSETFDSKDTDVVTVDRNFKYFKNNLIVRGKINTSNPKSIVTPNNDGSLFVNALESISVGDSLVGAYALDLTGDEDNFRISIKVDNSVIDNAKIKYAYFANNQFVAVQEDGVVYFNKDIDVASVVSDIDCKKAILFDNSENALYNGQVQMVGWTNDLGWYVEIKQNDNTSIICCISFLESTDYNGNLNVKLSPAYNALENRVFVDYNDNSHTLVGNYVGEYSNDKDADGKWNEYTHNDDSIKYTYEKSDSALEMLNNNAVVDGVCTQYVYADDNQGADESVKVFYKDLVISNAKIEQSKDDEKLFSINADFESAPFNASNAMIIKDGSKLPVSNDLLSRSVLKTDNSGKYTVYAKGRSLFIKSPTSIVSKDETGMYNYNGNLTTEPLWKHAYAPIFNDNVFLSIRSMLVNNKSSVDTLIEMSMMRILEILGNQVNLDNNQSAGITVNGVALNNQNKSMFDNVKDIFTVISGNPQSSGDSISFDNKVTYNKFISAMDKAKSNGKGVAQNVTETSYPLTISYKDSKWTFRCYGFKIISETITDYQSTIGSSVQSFAELAPSKDDVSSYFTEFVLEDNSIEPNYEHAYATFAYYYTYYLCGNGENTDIVLSSNINDIQFTNDSMLVTDVMGNVNSIGLCYLHNKEDIENPSHWITSSFPNELTGYSVERDLVGTSNYKVGDDYMSVPRPELLSKKNLFSVECSYANDEIILLGGYIYSKDDISSIYDNLFQGTRSNKEYQNWKNSRTNEEKEVESAWLGSSKFQKVTTPVMLYSVDGGSSFNITTLKSTDGKSLEWETSNEPSENFYVSGIIFAAGEYKVFVKGSNSNNNLMYYYYISSDNNGLFDFSTTSGSKNMDEYAEMSQAHEFDVDSTTGLDDILVPSGTASSGSQLSSIPNGNYRMMFTEGSNNFHIISTKALRFGQDVTVQSKTNNALTVSSALVKSGNTEFDVLLAFNTRNDIKDSISYLNMERAQNYVGNNGRLLVPEVTEVDSSSNANRMYSYRELLNSESLKDDDFGYPSVGEDNNYNLYEYIDAISPVDNSTFKMPKELINESGDNIYLCDATGNYYIYVDKSTNNRMLGTLEVRGSNDLSLFQVAYKPAYDSIEEAESDPSVRIKDDNFLLDLENQFIVSLSYEPDSPYVKVSTKEKSLIGLVKDHVFAKEDSFAFINYVSLNENNFVTQQSFNDIESAVDYINDLGNNRFTLKTIDGKELWYDTENNVYPLKQKRYISALAYVPYSFKSGLTSYKNVSFDEVMSNEQSTFQTPVTGVYLSNYGYGGSRSNQDFWSKTVPWIVDPDAFDFSSYLTNSKGEPVCLVDASGNKLKSYDAERTIHIGESFSIDSKFVGDDGSNVLYVYSDGDNIFKKEIKSLSSGKVTLYTPIKELKLGKKPFDISLWAYQSYNVLDIDEGSFKFKYYGRTSKNVWEYFDAKEFSYNSTTKTLSYTYSDDISGRIDSNLYVSLAGKYDVSELLITFTINGKEYEMQYSVSLNADVSEKHVIEVQEKSSPSIMFDSYAMYIKKDTYELIKMNLMPSTDGLYNRSVINLSVREKNIDENGETKEKFLGLSVVDASSEIILSTVYDNNQLLFNMQSSFEQLNTLVKIHVDDYSQVLNLQLPIFTLGNVQALTDINVTVDDGKIYKTYNTNVYLDDLPIDVALGKKFNVEAIPNDTNTFGEIRMSINSDGKKASVSDDTGTLILGNYEITEPYIPDEGGFYVNFDDGSTFSSGVDTITATVIKIDPFGELNNVNTVTVNGIYGELKCHRPLYNTFKELIDSKGYVIDKGDSSIIYENTNNDNLTVGLNSDDNRSISLSDLLNVKGLNDGNKHYLNMKWLTQSTIKTDIKNCNNDDEFIEISLSEKTKFPPDRVWFNPDGYPVPPVRIGNSIYNSENNEQYTGSSYKNNNGYSIYRCNEQGHLVGYMQVTDSSTIIKHDTNADGVPDNVEGYILNNNGDVESIILEYELNPYENVLTDSQIPNQPLYETCQEWFKNEFYIEGHESNPYWQVINVTSTFNKNHVWEQKMTINEYVKSTQEMVMQKVEEDDMYIVPRNTITIDVKNDTCMIIPNADPVDRTSGTISFVLDKPSIKYQTENQFIKYGITALNPFYESDVWDGKDKSIGGYVDSTYTVCNTKNLADPKDKDSEIQEVTEFGLFNKYHQLIAYAVFPPIEYRTSSQHISFTAYVKQGSCVDPSTL